MQVPKPTIINPRRACAARVTVVVFVCVSVTGFFVLLAISARQTVCTCVCFESTLSMASSKPWRQTAYDEDLRWKMVWQCEGLGHTYSAIAENWNVDKSTTMRTLNLFRNTGQIKKYWEGSQKQQQTYSLDYTLV